MAGIGPAPKDKSQRARASAPTRGEWKDLTPLDAPCLPELPDLGMAWNARTLRRWEAWRWDPVAAVTLANENDAIELAIMYQWAVKENTASAWNTVTKLMGEYALTPEARMRQRYRVVDAPKATVTSIDGGRKRERRGVLES